MIILSLNCTDSYLEEEHVFVWDWNMSHALPNWSVIFWCERQRTYSQTWDLEWVCRPSHSVSVHQCLLRGGRWSLTMNVTETKWWHPHRPVYLYDFWTIAILPPTPKDNLRETILSYSQQKELYVVPYAFGKATSLLQIMNVSAIMQYHVQSYCIIICS